MIARLSTPKILSAVALMAVAGVLACWLIRPSAELVAPARAYGGPVASQPFDAARWKAARGWDNTRCSMLADLGSRIGVVGKTRAELDRLLGPPEDEEDDRTSSHWHVCPSLVDIYVLEVRWRSDRAVSARVRDT